jgi:hypothetical protein
MSRSPLLLLLLSAVLLGCSWPGTRSLPPSAAEQMRDDALRQAKREGKQVYVWFTTADSEWCQLLERFHRDPAVAAILWKHFVEVRIDFYQTSGGSYLYELTGNTRGLPAFSLLDTNGALVADSGSTDEASNIGFPTTDEQRERYALAIKTALPQVSDDELTLLKDKLREVLAEHERDSAGSDQK